MIAGRDAATRLLVGVNPNKLRAAIGCTDGLLRQHAPDLVWLIIAGATDVLPDLLLSDLIGRDRERHELLEGHAIFGIDLLQLRRHGGETQSLLHDRRTHEMPGRNI